MMKQNPLDPFEETCRFSISPKSLIRGLQALRHVFIKILIRGESISFIDSFYIF